MPVRFAELHKMHCTLCPSSEAAGFFKKLLLG